MAERTLTSSYLKAENRNADRKSTRLNSSHSQISYAVFCLKKKKNTVSAVGCEPVTRDPRVGTSRARARLQGQNRRANGHYVKVLPYGHRLAHTARVASVVR